MLVASILGASQCGEVCSYFELGRQAVVNQPQPPCHHDDSDGPPASDQQCSHRQMVAEKKSSPPSSIEAYSIPVCAPTEGALASFSLTAGDAPIHSHHPVICRSVLRI